MHVAHSAIRPRLEILAKSPVPTRFGEFSMIVFRYAEAEPAQGVDSGSSGDFGQAGARRKNHYPTGLALDHVALVRGDVHGEGVTVRVHSECLTSEVFGSLKCDCRDQLEAAQCEIARLGRGIILYLRQEGRGIGLANKIRAYELQALGHDTVDANRLLHLPDDARDYEGAAQMLDHLGVQSVRLLTNNPLKVDGLRAHGVAVVERAATLIPANPFSAGYLEAKRDRMGHILPAALERPDGFEATSISSQSNNGVDAE